MQEFLPLSKRCRRDRYYEITGTSEIIRDVLWKINVRRLIYKILPEKI